MARVPEEGPEAELFRELAEQFERDRANGVTRFIMEMNGGVLRDSPADESAVQPMPNDVEP